MARLHLVRHAQASFGLENYDQLSELGMKQSTFIPKHFEKEIHTFYRGDMKRHAQTFENSFPDSSAKILPDLNEFDHVNVLQVHRPEIMSRDSAIELISRQSDPKKFLEEEFEMAMSKWINEEGTSAYNESFKTFKERSLEAVNKIIAAARKERQKEIVAITSGGFISLIMMHLLNLSTGKMIELNLKVANTSITTLLFNDEKISLSYFNNYSHLPKEMVTFR